jgi:hypothetical protein
MLLLAGASAGASPHTGDAAAWQDAGTEVVAEQATRTVSYEVSTRGAVEADPGAFEVTVREILQHQAGWWRAGVDFAPVASGGHFEVILASPEEVDAAHPVCSPQWSCRVGDQVLINDERWRTGTQAWTASLEGYRTYLINHEVGHWLGLGNNDCPGVGEPAPVMVQQSIDLEGCDPHGWPHEFEVDRVAELQGTTTRVPGRRWTISRACWSA